MTELTRSTGDANYKCVDEETANDDTDYVYYYNAQSYYTDVYNLTNHTTENGCINSITVYARCKVYDSRPGMFPIPRYYGYVKLALYLNGTTNYSSAFSLSKNSYSYFSNIWVENPDTGSAWTWNDIDDLQAGVSMIGNDEEPRCTQVYVEVNYTNWVAFGWNYSVINSNGTCRQVLNNASVNGQWWYWKVNVSDNTTGNESSIYSLYTGLQSKLENTGSTDIKGNLLIQVEYNNGTWELVNKTVDENHTINASSHLNLDQLFNGKENTSSYNNTGTYRIYAAFRDPEGNVLVCNDSTKLEATWEFEVTLT
jgi:hypothetical protein